jgi:hypothetical protein
VTVSGATYLTTDTYSETGSSADVGAVYVQDFYSGDAGAPPYSGIELYKPILVPSSMQLAPGDVIDLTGTYDLYRYSGWSAGEYQPEVNSPDVTFRFDYRAPAPTVIPVSDLENYSTGFKWMSMLVTVVDTVGGKLTEDGQGRCGVYLTGDVGQTAVTMANELYALNCYDPKYGGTKSTAQSSVHFKSVTGIVTFFFNFSIAPRSDADIVLAD